MCLCVKKKMRFYLICVPNSHFFIFYHLKINGELLHDDVLR